MQLPIQHVYEKSTAEFTATVQDENGTAIGSGSLTTLTLTLFDKLTNSIINSRNDQNVLNANGVTVSAQGALVWTMDPLDNQILNAELKNEKHVAMFKWTWSAGAKAGFYLFLIEVENTRTT